MKNNIRLSLILVLIISLAGCKKQSIGPATDLRPAVSITVSNAIDYRPEPTVSTSKAGGGAIQIVLSISSGLGRTIKEITKVSTSTNYTLVQGSTGAYNSAPIPGNGTTVTFTTSLTEYVVKAPGVIPASNTELAKRFYFIVTLDDGSVLVTMPARVLVLD